MKYIIQKTSRTDDKPYHGPTCQKANVTPGRYYDTFEAAQDDADKLSEQNSVGFRVVECSWASQSN